jgi:hypothetical protein
MFGNHANAKYQHGQTYADIVEAEKREFLTGDPQGDSRNAGLPPADFVVLEDGESGEPFSGLGGLVGDDVFAADQHAFLAADRHAFLATINDEEIASYLNKRGYVVYKPGPVPQGDPVHTKAAIADSFRGR